jgi:hypothetical protein
MLVLQNCTDSVKVLPGSSSEMSQTGCNGACDVSSTKVQGVNVKEEKNVGSEEDISIDIK